jgi:DNA-binding NtrC family response regulator
MGSETPNTVLVTFAALHGDPYTRDKDTGEYRQSVHTDPIEWGPTLRAVADSHSPLYRRVSDIYYLCHPAKQGPRRMRGRSAREVARDTQAAIDEHLPPGERPRFHAVTWETVRPPNDHAHLFEIVRKELRAIRATHPGVEIVLQLSSGTSAMHAVLLLAGSVGIIEGPVRLLQAERSDGSRKRPETPLVAVPFELDTILRVARSTVPTQPGIDQAASHSFDQARSSALRRTLSEVQRAARVRFPILLRGERGVGKSTIASVIRAASPFRDSRRDGSWPSLACGQFTDADRLNAELCGYPKGAFTGAIKDNPGLLAQANLDTLFLDEIHDLDVRSQRAIIRVIEEGVYYRLSENVPHKSAFRLITGSNQSDALLNQRLTPDFLDRIRDIEIVIPPLRDCTEDLPWMWRDTWTRIASQCTIPPSCLDSATPRIIERLSGHPLPGNWRDLRRLAVRVAICASQSDRMISRIEIERVLEEFCDVEKPARSISLDAANVPRLESKRDQNRFSELEKSLGPGFDKLWKRCDDGKALKLALTEILGERHRVQRAATFLARVFPDRCARLAKK